MKYITNLTNLASVILQQTIIWHSTKIKIILIFAPLFIITYTNHWLAGIAGCGFHTFISGMIIKVAENIYGLSSSANEDHNNISINQKDEAIKISILLCSSIVFTLCFSAVDPIRIIYLSGRY